MAEMDATKLFGKLLLLSTLFVELCHGYVGYSLFMTKTVRLDYLQTTVCLPGSNPSNMRPEFSRYSRWLNVDIIDIPRIDSQDILTVQNKAGHRTIIGKGASSIVYLCLLKHNNQPCVVKYAHSHVAASDIQNEAKMTWEMTSSGATMGFHGLLEHDGTLLNAFVMEYHPEGKLLSDVLQETNTIHHLELIQLVSGVAKALLEFHERGIFHGDVREDNILVVPRVIGAHGEPVYTDADYFFLDLGQAGHTNDSYTYKVIEEFRDFVKNHHQYIAPELLEGAQFSIATDLYAFGYLAKSIGLKYENYELVEMSNAFMGTYPMRRLSLDIALDMFEDLL